MKTNDEIKKLREKYIVVQKTKGDDSFYITERNNFETVNLCDFFIFRNLCFDNNGFKIGCFGAQCYSIDNSYSDATKDCLKSLYEYFEIEYSDDYLLFSIEEVLSGENDLLSEIDEKEISGFIKNWRENNEAHTEVDAWTYWDGCNYKTIILRSEMGIEDVIEIDDEKQDAILSELPEYPIMNKAIERIETENYMYTFTRFAGDPFHCEVYEK